MVSLSKHPKTGTWTARKAIPEDLRAVHAQRFGQAREVVFRRGSEVGADEARTAFAAWKADIEARMANLRAELRGVGRSLDPTEVRRLAARWFDWFVRRGIKGGQPAEHWEALLDGIGELWGHLVQEDDEEEGPWMTARARDRWRAALTDVGEIDAFLAEARLPLTAASRAALADLLEDDLAAALRLLIARAAGRPEEATEAASGVRRRRGSGLTIRDIVDHWQALRQPDATSVQRWTPVFRSLEERFAGLDPAELTPEHARAWRNELLADEGARSRRTVRDVWLNAAQTLFAFAEGEGMIPTNPFSGVARNVNVPVEARTRERNLTPGEAVLILNAALAVDPEDDPRGSRFPAVKRWAPWLLAYTGARIGEVLQLRRNDLIDHPEAGWTIRIRPENEKTGKLKFVPVHEHLQELGFVEFVKGRREEQLFFVPERFTGAVQAHAKVRTNLGNWVRGLGVTSQEIRPLHAWRHTFKSRAMSAGIERDFRDAIVGHESDSVGRDYEHASMTDLRKAIDRFPRYDLAAR